MKNMLNSFTGITFFNDTTEKVFLYKVNVVEDEGTITLTYVKDIEIKKKVIMPEDSEEVSERTLVKRAILYTYMDLEFFETKNSADAIMWQENLYLITGKYKRRDYGFAYSLEYMNKNEVTII